jgi:hypothetical protein
LKILGKRLRREQWIYVGRVLNAYTLPGRAQPPLKRSPLDTQLIVILKEIGVDTYKCLENNAQEPEESMSNQLRNKTRYLQELTSARVGYVDEQTNRKQVAMQNIPLVYGNSMLDSENWIKCRPELRKG